MIYYKQVEQLETSLNMYKDIGMSKANWWNTSALRNAV